MRPSRSCAAPASSSSARRRPPSSAPCPSPSLTFTRPRATPGTSGAAPAALRAVRPLRSPRASCRLPRRATARGRCAFPLRSTTFTVSSPRAGAYPSPSTATIAACSTPWGLSPAASMTPPPCSTCSRASPSAPRTGHRPRPRPSPSARGADRPACASASRCRPRSPTLTPTPAPPCCAWPGCSSRWVTASKRARWSPARSTTSSASGPRSCASSRSPIGHSCSQSRAGSPGSAAT